MAPTKRLVIIRIVVEHVSVYVVNIGCLTAPTNWYLTVMSFDPKITGDSVCC